MNTFNDLNNNIFNIIHLYIKNIIIQICTELNQNNKISYFINKYLENSNTSYKFFTNDIKPKLLKKFPNDTNEQISKRLNKLWNTLKPIHKKKYIKMEADYQKKSLNEEVVNNSINEESTNITKTDTTHSNS